MSGFPSLQPAFTVRLQATVPYDVGNVATGGGLQITPIVTGSIKSEPGFEPAIDGEVVYGSDYVRPEPGQTHARINVNAAIKNVDGALLSYSYTGVVGFTEQFIKILLHSPDATTTDYGDAFSQIKIETGAEHLKALEHSLFVGSAHFVIEEGKPMIIETKVSKIVG
ncbi:uncharacterized protein BDZ99DRAFT_569823 [Mytilinidion resinicola]|uniref:Uncharacterized protein n=1 Tax=Mytilinidion resinicola TaxID=574789 RepID=A0A6A6YSG5_9PEZI|nr:uncharacterized protein BDZ99DRAFT_569823 [Mytilinidion resinicola]KAF2811872.1 hypothetical protein BDZ99DRAFT_569823 [Mytilinidion resinicola]